MIMTLDVEAEILELKKRVGVLENTVALLAGEVRNIQPEISGLRTAQVDRFDGVDAAVVKLQQRLERLDLHVWSLRDDLPHLVSDAVKKALKT